MSDENNDIPHVCIDRILPLELAETASNLARSENPANKVTIPSRFLPPGTPPNSRGAAVTGKLWKPGRTLRVHFMDGEDVVKQKVEAVAHEWSKYANIKFEFVNDLRAEIRISFKGQGSWSYIGTDALTIPWFRPTMNYGWLTPTTADSEYERVVLHEFGHALGMIHEHQNPATTIPWNKEAVYEYYAGPPNNWSKAQTDQNLFKTYAADITQFTDFDRDSIMLYPVQQQFTIGDFEVGWNRTVSPQDIDFIGRLYPFEPRPENELTIGGDPVAASIGQLGEVDQFIFVVQEAGRYRVETDGRTDVHMTLYGPDDATAFLAEDDDSGRRLNAKIEMALQSGTYTIHIRHFSKERTGEYTVAVSKAS